MEGKDMTPNGYQQAVEAIKTAILQGQYEAAKGVNRIQLAVYFAVGKYISANTRRGVWGTGAVKSISEQLQKELPGLRGFSENSLKNMRKFYENWLLLDAQEPIPPGKEETTTTIVELENHNPTIAIVELRDQIDVFHSMQIPNTNEFPVEDFFQVPFTHHIRIIEMVDSLPARYYYIHRTAEEHLSVENLRKLIKNQAFEHQSAAPNNFMQTISDSRIARKAVEMFKDEYLLNFINVEEIGERDEADIDERVVEQQIVQNVKNFIMTFGHDFAFVGNQYQMEVYGVEHYPDLVFFNRELNALVIVELKTGDFKTSYLGQLMGYLTIADDHLRKPHENPSIGIVLCKSANKSYVEYMVRQYDKPMGVATYSSSEDMPERLRNALPDIEALKKLL